MNRISGFIIGGFAMLAAAGFGLPPATAAGSDYTAAAESGRDLTTKELYGLYKDRSWIWKDGVAYFQVSRREFKAWTGQPGPDASYGDGRWFLPGNGKTCFRATWNTTVSSSQALTCFAHRIDDRGTVYMHKVPDGKWFVFSKMPPHPWDEAKKFKPGDRAAKGYLRNKAYVDSNKPEKACSLEGWPGLVCHLFGT